MFDVSAEEALEEIAKRGPDDHRFLLRLARVALDMGYPIVCQRLLIRARTVIGGPDQRAELATSFAELASHFTRVGDLGAARLSLERSLRINPSDHTAREQLHALGTERYAEHQVS
ncbi:MAG: hypothetical protein AAF928_15080 [Myxococcota bacterium]